MIVMHIAIANHYAIPRPYIIFSLNGWAQWHLQFNFQAHIRNSYTARACLSRLSYYNGQLTRDLRPFIAIISRSDELRRKCM